MIVLEKDFSSLFPPDTAFAPCSSTKEAGRIYEEEWRSESITGVVMSCLGRMPAICHQNVATEAALDFFRLAGVEPPSRLGTYASEGEALALARRFVADGLRLASIYPHIESIRALDAGLVAPALYDWLNDKTNLEHLCPASFIPKRRVLSRESVPSLQPGEQTYPLVAKGAVAGANGSGNDVRLCTHEKDLAEFLSWFAEMPVFKALILEEAIPFTATWCLNYAVLDKKIHWLGGAEQLFSSPTEQSGSRIDPALPPPAEAIDIGRDICASAQAKGFRGIAGLDMCVDQGARVYFFDLNFRLASSTCFILISGSMEDQNLVGLTVDGLYPGPIADFLPRLEDLARAGQFVPLRLYDGSTCKLGEAPSVIDGFVRGEDRDAAQDLVKEVENRLSR
jgi:hypothetical protein